MISRELSEKLKGAGLRWEPQRGDWFGDGKYNRAIGEGIILTNTRDEIKKYGVWLPFLSQLLTEIEKRGWKWSIEVVDEGYEACISKYDWKYRQKYEFADTPEEAAGLALLWILKEGGSNA